jgi:hypothetical protein
MRPKKRQPRRPPFRDEAAECQAEIEKGYPEQPRPLYIWNDDYDDDHIDENQNPVLTPTPAIIDTATSFHPTPELTMGSFDSGPDTPLEEPPTYGQIQESYSDSPKIHVEKDLDIDQLITHLVKLDTNDHSEPPRSISPAENNLRKDNLLEELDIPCHLTRSQSPPDIGNFNGPITKQRASLIAFTNNNGKIQTTIEDD